MLYCIVYSVRELAGILSPVRLSTAWGPSFPLSASPSGDIKHHHRYVGIVVFAEWSSLTHPGLTTAHGRLLCHKHPRVCRFEPSLQCAPA